MPLSCSHMLLPAFGLYLMLLMLLSSDLLESFEGRVYVECFMHTSNEGKKRETSIIKYEISTQKAKSTSKTINSLCKAPTLEYFSVYV